MNPASSTRAALWGHSGLDLSLLMGIYIPWERKQWNTGVVGSFCMLWYHTKEHPPQVQTQIPFIWNSSPWIRWNWVMAQAKHCEWRVGAIPVEATLSPKEKPPPSIATRSRQPEVPPGSYRRTTAKRQEIIIKSESNPLRIAIFKRFSKDLNQIHSRFHGLNLFFLS